MTQEKKLKKAIRERKERTGESYTAARAAVLAERAALKLEEPRRDEVTG